ncbi:transcription repressor OFP7-like [Ananas comosus]|uniref:Transcription repressor n=1 Tax=Ananas comosus TaxID=4615 RepID=A0A6P5G939_ANACO|nr:transcription repressor OFP7-like [Ananas comosus]
MAKRFRFRITRAFPSFHSCRSTDGDVAVTHAVIPRSPEIAAEAPADRSEDPRGDFRRSMAEMVVEKEIYDAAGLEQLLRCLLSLNDRRHHRAITTAFGDIWDAVFPSPARLR